MTHPLTLPAVLVRNGEQAVLSCQTGRVRETATGVAGELDARPGGPGGGHLLLDFRNVEYVGSRDLGSLVVLNRKVRGAGGTLSLVNVGPAVSDVFAVTRLDTILDVHRAEKGSGVFI